MGNRGWGGGQPNRFCAADYADVLHRYDRRYSDVKWDLRLMCTVWCSAVLASGSTGLRSAALAIVCHSERRQRWAERGSGLIAAAQTQIHHISPTGLSHRGGGSPSLGCLWCYIQVQVPRDGCCERASTLGWCWDAFMIWTNAFLSLN